MKAFINRFYQNEYAFGALVLRYAFGLLFLFVAVKKLRMGYGGFADSLVNPETATNISTDIPAVFLTLYGYILPGLELAVGAALILNKYTREAFVAIALIYLTFVFGQMYNLNTAKIGTEYMPSLVALVLAVYCHERARSA